MKYEMEDLILIVAKLSEKYTRNESTSITYEKAEQLMEAVLYCIHEIELQDIDMYENKEELISTQANMLFAKEAYEYGYKLITQKVQDSLLLYHEILQDFDSYGNTCLSDTFLKGMPEFFKWYDTKFNPQDTILTLDYPILTNISNYQGVDAIWEYLKCIQLEQLFLKKMKKSTVIAWLAQYSKAYKSMIENLSYVVFSYILKYMLLGKQLDDMEFTEEDRKNLRLVLSDMEDEQLLNQSKYFTKQFILKFYDGRTELLEYLQQAIEDITVRLKKSIE